MKIFVIIFSLFFVGIHCDLPLVNEITELTDLNQVIGAALTLSRSYSLNSANSFVRNRQDFGIEFLMELVNRFNIRSFEIRQAIETDLQHLLTFYASNQVLHDAVQRLVNQLVTLIASTTGFVTTNLKDTVDNGIPAGDFIFNDLEVNHQRLRSRFGSLNRGCANDFENYFHSLKAGPSECGKMAVTAGEILYLDWGFKLADVYQDFLDATEIEILSILSNEQVLTRFSEFDEEVLGVLNGFKSYALDYITNAYNQYLSCVARTFVSSRTSEKSLKQKLACLNLPTIGLGLSLLGNTLGIK